MISFFGKFPMSLESIIFISRKCSYFAYEYLPVDVHCVAIKKFLQYCDYNII